MNALFLLGDESLSTMGDALLGELYPSDSSGEGSDSGADNTIRQLPQHHGLHAEFDAGNLNRIVPGNRDTIRTEQDIALQMFQQSQRSLQQLAANQVRDASHGNLIQQPSNHLRNDIDNPALPPAHYFPAPQPWSAIQAPYSQPFIPAVDGFWADDMHGNFEVYDPTYRGDMNYLNLQHFRPVQVMNEEQFLSVRPQSRQNSARTPGSISTPPVHRRRRRSSIKEEEESAPLMNQYNSSTSQEQPGYAPYTGYFETSADANRHLCKIRRPYLHNEELKGFEDDRDKYVKQLYDAMICTKHINDNDNSLGVRRFVREHHYHEIDIEARCSAVFDAVLDLHRVGFRGPDSRDFATHGVSRNDRRATAPQRIELICAAVRQEKAAAIDVMNGKIEGLVNSPEYWKDSKMRTRQNNEHRKTHKQVLDRDKVKLERDNALKERQLEDLRKKLLASRSESEQPPDEQQQQPPPDSLFNAAADDDDHGCDLFGAGVSPPAGRAATALLKHNFDGLDDPHNLLGGHDDFFGDTSARGPQEKRKRRDRPSEASRSPPPAIKRTRPSRTPTLQLDGSHI